MWLHFNSQCLKNFILKQKSVFPQFLIHLLILYTYLSTFALNSLLKKL